MRFQQRDGEILQTIYENDGVLARRHLKALFWPDKSWRAMEQRLAKLYRVGYLAWPSQEQRRIHPIPEPVCWLGWKGVLFIAGQSGVEVKQPTGDNENQLRLLQSRLRKRQIRWVREPRWSLLAHDLAVIDFRLSLERAANQLPSLNLEKWLPESAFRSHTDVIAYTIRGQDGKVKRSKKGVCPDAYFEIVDENRRLEGTPPKARFLLELDMATHDNPRFGREKVGPGAAYIRSPHYRGRFGANSGHWLVVTSGGARRIMNLMRQAQESAGPSAKLFFFTSLEQLEKSNVLTSPIWQQAGLSKPRAIL